MKKALNLFTLLVVFGLVFTVVACATKTTSNDATTNNGSTTDNTDKPSSQLQEHTPPVITGAQDVTVEVNSRFVPTKGVTAVDEDGTDITDDIYLEGTVNTRVVGTYNIALCVTDKNGLTTRVPIVVTVVSTDKEGAIITGASNTNVPL